MDLGVLLGLPLESVAIRVVLATVLATVLVRVLLRAGLRSPAARVGTALVPALAIGGVLLLSWGSLAMPTLMLPVDAPDALPVPVRDGYVHFAPIAVPLLAGIWALVAGLRVVRRGRATAAARGAARVALRDGEFRPEIVAIAQRLSAELRIPVPRVAVVSTCTGGAYVVGCRRPVLVIGDDLVARLDAAELEGVIAHELAHVRRRDNLMAILVGLVRDLTFFIPVGGWALTHLHRERELAADQMAIDVTGRPGALASGLLKVVEGGHEAEDLCAALAPSGTLVSRVQVLVEENEGPSRSRRVLEKVGVASMCVAAVGLAVAVPRLVTGPEGQRDALALVWSSAATSAVEDAVPVAEPRALDVYRRTSFEVDSASRGVASQPDERSVENRRSTLYACQDGESCPDTSSGPGLGLTPRPSITVDDELTRRWEVGSGMSTGGSAGFQALWLHRVD